MSMPKAPVAAPQASATPLLRVDDLLVHFPLPKTGWFSPPEVVRAVDGVSFSIPRGTTLALVGESGSGKTTTALAVMRLAPITAGQVQLGDTALGSLQGEALRAARRRFQIIFQDPFSSLNPRERAGATVRVSQGAATSAQMWVWDGQTGKLRFNKNLGTAQGLGDLGRQRHVGTARIGQPEHRLGAVD